MILDYNYNKTKRTLSVSYINERGGKSLLNFNVSKFKSYYSTPDGNYNNWDGAKCDIKYTDKPSMFDIKTYLAELPEKYSTLLNGKYTPRMFTFDIETAISEDFPEPSEARQPITTISIANDKCDVIILGTRPIGDGGDEYLKNEFEEYLKNCKFFQGLKYDMPYIKYVEFKTEKEMLEYFLKNIVAKAAVIAGWNSIMFDWQYIQNRIRIHYPDLSLNCCSMDWTMTSKNYSDMRGNKVRMSIPNHTLILDMMDVVGNFDIVVMPIKESLSLDYIASESIGVNKIKYDGSLQDLYDNDYPKYVFYNAIDSILVQLIDKRFKTMQNIYAQAQYCKEKVGSCFSKIDLADALFFNYFYDNNIKIVPMDNYGKERGTLVGAYVAKPTPGVHKWVTCNDFASLYPSIIRTTNISIENFVGSFYDQDKLNWYRSNPADYMIVGGSVYINNGTALEPALGDLVCNCFLEDELDIYRKDPNYFVSACGHVYKNDKDYSFRCIQTNLANDRNRSKYLAKELDATVMADIDHMMDGKDVPERKYSDSVINALDGLGFSGIKTSNDLVNINLQELKPKLKSEILYLGSFEQACKLLMNSLYGGSSHVAFAFFSLELANDITGEARCIIHKMEDHIPNWFEQNWLIDKDLHKLLGVEIKKDAKLDPEKPLVKVVAGDTDSLYLCYNQLVNTIKGSETMSISEIRDIIVNMNTKFLDKHNEDFMNEYYNERHAKSVQKFELETVCWKECRLDVKKRYAQLLVWKDGKVFDTDHLPLKVKGLEIAKSSYPKQTREGLKRLVTYFLQESDDQYLVHKLNIQVKQELDMWMNADLEDICGSVGVQNYTKYIVDDSNPNGLIIAPKCPFNCRALGNYNRMRNVYNLPGDPLYGGKMKWYIYKPIGANPKTPEDYFAFQSKNYPEWAPKYAPIDRRAMFQHFMLDPFNRIITASGVNKLNIDGSVQLELF